MLHKRRKKDKCPIGRYYTSTLPSLTFTNIYNLLHGKSTYFYKWWNYTIPSVCILALLIGLYVSVNPIADNDDSVYATDDDASTYALDPSLALTIGGAGVDETVQAYIGMTAYKAHTVSIVVNDAKSYSLMLTGPTKLVNTTTELTGAGEKTPAAMNDNTWGYSYGETVAQDKMTYHSLTGTAQVLESGVLVGSSGGSGDGSINTTKNLVFAAKFGRDAVAGHYTGNVMLSLVAEAKTIVEYSISYNANVANTSEVTNLPQS